MLLPKGYNPNRDWWLITTNDNNQTVCVLNDCIVPQDAFNEQFPNEIDRYELDRKNK